MSYRFTNTDKWGDAWFSNLKPNEKLLFIYFYENCDIAGFIELNIKRWGADIGLDSRGIEGALKGLARGLIYSTAMDCIFIRTFLKHQKNLPLNPEKNPAHRGIIKRFDEYAFKFNIKDINEFIKGASEGLGSPLGNGNGNGSDLGKGKGKSGKLDFSFVEDIYKTSFETWIEYKKDRGETYKNQKSLESCYNRLLKLAGGDAVKVADIIQYSLANNYAGLFQLKNNNDGNFGIKEKERKYESDQSF